MLWDVQKSTAVSGRYQASPARPCDKAVTWRWELNVGGMLLTGEHRRTRSNTCPTATLCTINLAWTAHGVEKGASAGTYRRLKASSKTRLACSMPDQNCFSLTSQLSENTFYLNYTYKDQLHKCFREVSVCLRAHCPFVCAVPVCLRAKCPFVSAQSVRMSPRSARMSPRKVSVCLRAKCPHVSVQCPFVSAHSVRMSPRIVSVCLRTVSACLRAVPVCLRAKCPFVSAQCPMSPWKVSACLRAKCPHVSVHSVRMSPCSVRLSPRIVSVCLRAKCRCYFCPSLP